MFKIYSKSFSKFYKIFKIMESENKLANKTKIEYPKRKFAIIHGYFGHDFCGNQK